MKTIIAEKPSHHWWHSILLTAALVLSIFSFEVLSAEPTIIQQQTVKIGTDLAQSAVQENVRDREFGCRGNEVCLRIMEICEEEPEFCWELILICIDDHELCEEILFPPECEFDDEECEEFPECDEETQDCDAYYECIEEGGEDCERFLGCDEEDETCDSVPQCEENEEGECEVVFTGYENPNPVPSDAVFSVEKDAAERASRFLTQSTLGANYPLVTLVASMGEAAWLESQFNEPVGYLFPYTDYLINLAESTEVDGEYTEVYGQPFTFHLHAWWTQVMTSPDLVRQRVALALSEIFVISSNVEVIGESPYAITHYYDALLQHSFGNYRDILKGMTLNPAMAIYLSHLNNEKANPQTGTFPDENYAREVMQLFSIGLFELNQDGTRKQDTNGNDIPTYGQQEIREFAKIFTGLAMNYEEGGFGSVPCCNEDFYQYARDMLPLEMFDAFHSQGEKRLLNGAVVPAGQTGIQDLEDAIDNLFNHPNVGPFIGKQLIQRLVKSNPSPAYVARVAAAFNGATGAPRGDMKALIRAVLLDPEAQQMPQDATPADGRLQEPFIRLVRLMRAFDATTPDRNHAGEGFEISAKLKQYVFFSPSVFNFFQPGFSPNGAIRDANLVAPEFQIVNASTIIEIKNFIDRWLDVGVYDDRVGQLATETVSFERELELANEPLALIDHLDVLLTYGQLSPTTREAILTVVESEREPVERVKKAVYLIAISPDFAVSL